MPIQFLSLQGASGTAVPYERRNAPYYLSAIATNPQDSLRLKRYEEHWRFYSGIQWSFQREDGEPLVTANYCRAIVNKKASWLVGKGMVIEVPEALEHRTKPILEEVWNYNQRNRLLLEMAITGGVTGDVFFMTTYQPPTTQQKAINPYTQGKIRVRLLGSHQVFPTWNPLNHEEIVHVRIITEVVDQNPLPEEGAERLRSPITVGSLSVQRKNRYIEDIYPNDIYEGWEDEPRTWRANDLGEIPLVHITNEPFPNEFYGMSDLDGIIDIQREYNEKLTDISDIVNYHAGPITIMIGARAAHLERGPKALWSGLPADAKVFNLALEGDLPASHKYMETVLQIMFDLSNMPEGSLGRMQPISNTSGLALQVTFQPLIEAMERKNPSYTDGLEKVNYYILRYHQLATGESYPVDLCKTCGGRIVELQETGQDGSKKVRRKCFLIDPQTLDFMDPEDVNVNIKRMFSYGVETRMLPFRQVKAEFLKESASYWDPRPPKDQQQELEDDQERAKAAEDFRAKQQDSIASDQADAAAAQRAEMAPPSPGPNGEPAPAGPEAPAAESPAAKTPGALPLELEKPPEAQPEKLAPHDMDIPEEPEEHNVTVMEWNPTLGLFIATDLGKMKIVPSGCKRPRHQSPYETQVKLRSALPRDRERDANLYGQYQLNQWVSRRWVQEKLDEDINFMEVDKQIADDIPFILAAKGVPDPGQVAQTAGAGPDQPGDNNGAPLPPGPGPGRGNKFAPGDNMAGAAGRTPTGAAQGGQ